MLKKYVLVLCLVFGTIEANSNGLISNLFNARNYQNVLIDFVAKMTRELSNRCTKFTEQRKSYYRSWTDINKISMLMYARGKFRVFKMPTAADEIWNSPDFHRNSPTVLYLHGYMGNPDQEIARLFARSIQLKEESNFLTVDMRKILTNDFIQSTGTVPYLGKIISDALVNFYMKGLPMDKFHIITYSLGGQIAGIIGRTFKNRTNTEIFRITALDPSMWCYVTPQSMALSSHDASYVDVLHTTLLSITDSPIGHADFYANNLHGFQPGCWINMRCSHRRSIYLFLESIFNSTGFPAVRCTNPKNSLHNCENFPTSYMGFKSPTNSRGIYIFKTKNTFPFASDSKGIE